MNFWEAIAFITVVVLCTPLGWIGLGMVALIVAIFRS